MKTWLKLWSLPLGFLIVWFTLSYNDWNFGTFLFSRQMHDEFLIMYSSLLGVEIADLPGLFLKALLVDGVIIVALIVFVKRRKQVFGWVRQKLGFEPSSQIG